MSQWVLVSQPRQPMLLSHLDSCLSSLTCMPCADVLYTMSMQSTMSAHSHSLSLSLPSNTNLPNCDHLSSFLQFAKSHQDRVSVHPCAIHSALLTIDAFMNILNILRNLHIHKLFSNGHNMGRKIY